MNNQDPYRPRTEAEKDWQKAILGPECYDLLFGEADKPVEDLPAPALAMRVYGITRRTYTQPEDRP